MTISVCSGSFVSHPPPCDEGTGGFLAKHVSKPSHCLNAGSSVPYPPPAGSIYYGGQEQRATYSSAHDSGVPQYRVGSSIRTDVPYVFNEAMRPREFPQRYILRSVWTFSSARTWPGF